MTYVAEAELEMQLVNVKYNFAGTYIIFNYTADKRVDFRNLVKQLARDLHARIEMHQITMREKARVIGGGGPCGYDLCCSTFLHDLHGSTIKMVKNQQLSLVPERISGICGKLLCCLRYENDLYTELAQYLPDINQKIDTPHGSGRVTYVNILKQEIDVEFIDEKGDKKRVHYDYQMLKSQLLAHELLENN